MCRALVCGWKEASSVPSGWVVSVCCGGTRGLVPRSALTLQVSLCQKDWNIEWQINNTMAGWERNCRKKGNLGTLVPLLELLLCILNRGPHIFILHGALQILEPILIGTELTSAIMYCTHCPLVSTASSYICFKFRWHNKKIFSETVWGLEQHKTHNDINMWWKITIKPLHLPL